MPQSIDLLTFFLRAIANVFMTEQTVQSLMDALEGACKTMGASSLEEGIGTATRFFQVLSKNGTRWQSRESLLEDLQAMPEPSAPELLMIVSILNNLPALMIIGTESLSDQLKNEFGIRNSGRPRSFTAAESRELCGFVALLYAEGVELKVAKNRAAAKYGVSFSTINRVWRERKTPKLRQPTPKEMIAYLTATDET